jgi:hypothetical protein
VSRQGHLSYSHGGPRTRGSHSQRKGPLRKIVEIVRHGEGIFDRDSVILECGHKTISNAQYKARCEQCQRIIDVLAAEQKEPGQ